MDDEVGAPDEHPVGQSPSTLPEKEGLPAGEGGTASFRGPETPVPGTAGCTPREPLHVGPLEKAFFAVVREALAGGDSVRIGGLGVLSVRTSAPRVGRNPRTGERLEIPERRRVRFHQSAEMRSLLND